MPKHCLTGLEFSSDQLQELVSLAIAMKKDRLSHYGSLANKHLALLFEKPSLRTRSSFMVAMYELGGHIVEHISANRKAEEPEDLIRGLQGWVHGVMIRTFEDSTFERMVPYAKIPIINGLSDMHHPCQILADIMVLKEKFPTNSEIHLSYIGDGNNILHSLMLMGPLAGIHIHYCCPESYGPTAVLLRQAQRLHPGFIHAHTTPADAVKEAHAVYTDVWSSMGFDARDETVFEGYQVNESLMAKALPNAIFMHCMPMVRGKEVSKTLPDSDCSAIFDQSENRLHVQKALLYTLMKGNN
jgi:ornithine carbamoyltransferase